MKLTEERFKELVEVAKFLLHHDPEMSRDTAIYLTNKGQKFIKRYDDFPKLEQENKHLKIDNQNFKSDYESYKELFEKFQKENITLKEKLEKTKRKIDSHIYACNEMLKDGENETDEEEENTEIYTHLLKYFTELKEILDSKEGK